MNKEVMILIELQTLLLKLEFKFHFFTQTFIQEEENTKKKAINLSVAHY